MYLAWLLLTLYASAYVQDREIYGYGYKHYNMHMLLWFHILPTKSRGGNLAPFII